MNNPLSPSKISWSWHNPQPQKPEAPQSPIPNHTWVEVMHREYPKDEKAGAWMFYAPGSGIWFNLGNSITFMTHGDGFEYFNASFNINSTHNNPKCVNNSNITTTNECMSTVAAEMGYDSIQFLDTWPLSCPSKKIPNATKANMNYEFVAVKMQGEFACTSANGTSPVIRTGWRGDRQCTCINNGTHGSNLNCEEIPV